MRICAWLSVRLLLIFAALSLCVLALPGQEAAPSAAPREQTMLFVGDVMLSRGVGRRIVAEGDWTFPFQKIADTLRAADLTFGNLECPVSDIGKNQHHLYSFRADPNVIEGLTFAGFDVMSVANNHMCDWGPAALVDTVERLRGAGIRPVGAGVNDLEAHYPVLVNLGGVKLAFLAYVDIPPREATAGPTQPGVAWLDEDRVLADIRFARPLADVVIVAPHWGIEYAKRPEKSQVRFARRMIDAGADLIVGSHPHVVQPLEEYHGRWIAYSLGNFVFDQRNPKTHRGLMLRVKLQGRRINRVDPLQVEITPTFQAQAAPQKEDSSRATAAPSPHAAAAATTREPQPAASENRRP
jgi:poly-gamma-glutamate capsule biosynthesis protein CapA/YwtB (metallophosphatase superfamily)